MVCLDIERTICEARGYAELGLFTEAWELIESLPPERRADLAALAVRILVCAGLGKWEMGAEIVRLFGPGHPVEIREAAGRFHLAHAESLALAGDMAAARYPVADLAAVWPEGRDRALDSAALAALWE